MVELWEHQKIASEKVLERLNLYQIAYMQCEMRTGKTKTAMDALNRIDDVANVLWIAPLKAVPDVKQQAKEMPLTYLLTVINKEQLHKYTANRYDAVVIDEAHNFGGFPKPSLCAFRLRKIAAKYHLLLSGTSFADACGSQMFHQLWACYGNQIWSEYKNFYAWARAGYVNPKQIRTGAATTVTDYSEANADWIKDSIGHIWVALTQKEAGGFLEVEEEYLEVDMGEQTRTLLKAMKKDNVFYFKSEAVCSAPTPASVCNKLHQLSGGSVIDDDNNAHVISWEKVRAINTYIMQHPNERIAVYYAYIKEGEMLRERIIAPVASTPEQFRESLNSVFIGQHQSNKEGIDLRLADVIIMYSTPWSHVCYAQIKQRANVRGREIPSRLLWLVGKWGIDSHIIKALQEKASKHKTILSTIKQWRPE